MEDETIAVRQIIQAEIHKQIGPPDSERARLEAIYGQVWDTDELRNDFTVTGFMAPFVGVSRRSDNKKGSLMFQHNPRFYFSWTEAA